MPIVVMQLPSGRYLLSKAGVAASIGKERQSTADFLQGDSREALPFKTFKPVKVKVEGKKGAPAEAVPIELATAYWRYWDKQGNIEAGAIVDACIFESIERRADKAFGVSRTEDERNQDFAVRVDDYVLKNAVPWNIKVNGAKPFINEFYEHLYRIRGGIWQKRNPNSSQRPACVGAWTNKFVYDLFPGAVPEKLREQYKNQPGSRRKYEFLTQEIGRTHLIAHMAALLAIMRNAMPNNWDRFLKMVEVGIPSSSILGIQMELGFLIEIEEEWAKRLEN
jgi:hypothetical protein